MSLDIRIERVIAATPEEIFDAFVDPEARRHWFAPEDGWIIDATTDLRVGGTYSATFGPSADSRWTESGTFLEIDRPQRLVYTADFHGPEGLRFTTTVTLTLEARDGKTLLTLVDAGFPDAEQRDMHAGGWPSFLDRFERLVTTGSV